MAKKVKYINKVKLPLVRACPGAVNHFCCNYVVVSQILGCPFNCSYCFLHTFYGQDEIVVFQDEAEVVRQVKAFMEQAAEPFHIGTGEYSDSLAVPDAVSLGKTLIGLFARQDKHLLELKTKSANVEELLGLEHHGQTVIAWSVNPERIVRSEEEGAVNLEERLAGAKKCVAAGYPVAFHFDPIIYYEGWENDYRAVVDLIFARINSRQIAWISLGALRFQPKMKEVIKDRFPRSIITFENFEAGEDGKLRYFKPIRVEIFQKMRQLVRMHSRDVYVYLCMESPDVWQAAEIRNEFENKYKQYFKFSVK